MTKTERDLTFVTKLSLSDFFGRGWGRPREKLTIIFGLIWPSLDRIEHERLQSLGYLKCLSASSFVIFSGRFRKVFHAIRLELVGIIHVLLDTVILLDSVIIVLIPDN